MAAITGLLNNKGGNSSIESMLEAMKHRGPDMKETYKSGGFEGGVIAQDLGNDRGSGFAQQDKTVVFFDGEIYNHRSPGRSDAEVVLELFQHYGRTFPGYCKGVFACAVWDGNELFCVRGPVGVRPLFYGTTDSGA